MDKNEALVYGDLGCYDKYCGHNDENGDAVKPTEADLKWQIWHSNNEEMLEELPF